MHIFGFHIISEHKIVLTIIYKYKILKLGESLRIISKHAVSMAVHTVMKTNLVLMPW